MSLIFPRSQKEYKRAVSELQRSRRSKTTSHPAAKRNRIAKWRARKAA